ncbi:MAG: bifunctional methylenetetrahydrofolate dehydrogenase/methenyltetrahydrofolate cyclohydrolase FolD [Rhodobacteraceae bacterium]|nr:bifunctional methylenetetrahydrofolate dehydrogenase/methenyltetrahydrofolate cyclohydrolase FolD [Paracoccaceae bacterium]|tara:strand:- start:1274 stop:2167 length:894 start_codon:yes stop_codon:yes gene_type:complete
MNEIIDGKKFSQALRYKVKNYVEVIKEKKGVTPGLAVILVGEDPASQVYVRNKGKQTLEAGMNSYEHKLDASTPSEVLLGLIKNLNRDPNVHGILCQLPLPNHLNEKEVINAINPEKDVDGFHISNVGLLNTGQKSMIPCTPLGCLLLLKDRLGDLSGKKAVIVGRSNIVGKPMANLLLQENCTVTIAHSRTENIENTCAQADIIVAAIGKPEMIKKEWVKKGATVIDVGINRVTKQIESNEKTVLVGDVCFSDMVGLVAGVTPVPGGVGPMTIACLLANTVTACYRSQDLSDPEFT